MLDWGHNFQHIRRKIYSWLIYVYPFCSVRYIKIPSIVIWDVPNSSEPDIWSLYKQATIWPSFITSLKLPITHLMMSKMKNWSQYTSQDLKNHPDNSQPRKVAQINMPDCELQWLRVELTHSFLLLLPQVPGFTESQLWDRYLGEVTFELVTANFTKAFLPESTAFQSPFKSKIAAEVGLSCPG